MALYAIPKRLRDTNGSGVICDIEWYASDPSNDRDLQPVLIDQILLPVPSVDRVTDADIAEAMERREPEVEREIAPQLNEPSSPRARAMIGKSRRVEGRRQR